MLQDLQCFCDLDAFVHIHECLHCWTCVSANQKAVRNWMFVTSVSERTNNENDAKMMHYLNCATMHVHWLIRLQLKIKCNCVQSIESHTIACNCTHFQIFFVTQHWLLCGDLFLHANAEGKLGPLFKSEEGTTNPTLLQRQRHKQLLVNKINSFKMRCHLLLQVQWKWSCELISVGGCCCEIAFCTSVWKKNIWVTKLKTSSKQNFLRKFNPVFFGILELLLHFHANSPFVSQLNRNKTLACIYKLHIAPFPASFVLVTPASLWHKKSKNPVAFWVIVRDVTLISYYYYFHHLDKRFDRYNLTIKIWLA